MHVCWGGVDVQPDIHHMTVTCNSKFLMTHEFETCTCCQSGLMALKVAQSEAHLDICDILLQYTRQGSKVILPEQESESTEEEETKAEVGMDMDDNNWR